MLIELTLVEFGAFRTVFKLVRVVLMFKVVVFSLGRGVAAGNWLNDNIKLILDKSLFEAC